MMNLRYPIYATRTLLSLTGLCLLMGVCTSCTGNWLDDASSTNQTSDKEIFSNTDEATLVISGIAHLMYTPYTYGGMATQWNGEGSIQFYYGNLMGNHFVLANRDGFAGLARGATYMANATSVYDYFPWGYYYRLITNANALIEHIDGVTGDAETRQFLKAQALTFRAYSYLQLSQLYCSRWLDDPDGSTRGLPLRLSSDDTGSMAASTLSQTFDRIYTDLSQADALYAASGLSRGESYWLPDSSVNNAVWARAALVKGDYLEARNRAQRARAGFALMSSAVYKSGFNTRNSETIWANPGTSTAVSLDEASFFSQQMAYDRSYYIDYPSCISKELFDQFPARDIRRQLFLDPRSEDYVTEGSRIGYIADDSALSDSITALYPDVCGSLYAYQNFKFKCADDNHLGEGVLSLVRSSEMYLIEAEADYFLGQEDQALSLVYSVNRTRNPAYRKPSISGDAVFAEIRRTRAFELWGEGFDWFDYKRWGLPIQHNGYPDGNFYAALIYTTEPSANNGWTWVYPNLEADYNDLVSVQE